MKSKAFTIVELMIVLVVMGILAGLLFPALARAREKGRQAQCASNLKELHAAMTAYLSNNNGRYPYATTFKEIEQDDLFHERKGWVACRDSKPPDNGSNLGNTDLWDGGSENGTKCITNGTLYPYVTDIRIYMCPTFEREFKELRKNAIPVRNYVMNWEMNGCNLYSLRNGSKIMLFTELNHSERYENITRTLNWALRGGDNSTWPTFPNSIRMYSPRYTDGALMLHGGTPSTVPPLEGIAAYHNGKGNVIFADGHIEYLHTSNTYETAKGIW